MNVTLHERNEQLGQLQQQLPGSIPYDNLRPINVPARCEGMSLQECLKEVFPQVSQAQWNSWFSDGHILHRDARADRNAPVKGGQQFWHLFPNTIEPEVNACVKIIMKMRVSWSCRNQPRCQSIQVADSIATR